MGMTKADKAVSSFLRATEWSLLYSTEIVYARNNEELMNSHFHLISRFLMKKRDPIANIMTGSPFIEFGIIGNTAKVKISPFKMFTLLIVFMLF